MDSCHFSTEISKTEDSQSLVKVDADPIARGALISFSTLKFATTSSPALPTIDNATNVAYTGISASYQTRHLLPA
jgi:hypothetical protein